MLEDGLTTPEYQCSRCGGIFNGQGSPSVCCPYCAMICDEISCRLEKNEQEK
ncbi:Hypothetical protein LUCI_4711 [Lucifera butyrica]|uniref:Uncharacterized protein n=1 Tax=Lucifera butyrica TaxID=1351585 RepID=A0A498RD87_9FIRM|nr:hypothetical protein [Lucifera butyrica]VBB09421.1 Hypothetical protein LUCI_4711 [Lucifera butyrica]